MTYAKLRKGARGDRWQGMFRDPLGVWRSAGCFDKKPVAEREARRAQLRVDDGDWLPPESESPLVTDWLDVQLVRLERTVEHTTFEGYESIIENHIRPILGHLRLQGLTPGAVSAFIDALTQGHETDGERVRHRHRVPAAAAGADSKKTRQKQKRRHRPLSAKTIRNYHALLRYMLSDAVATGLLRSNPAAGAHLPVVVQAPKRSITYATFLDVLDQIPPWWALLVELAAESGARWGEILAFRVGSLDGDLWLIRQTITETTKVSTGTDSQFRVKKYPKGRDARDVLLDGSVVEKLRALANERGCGPDAFLFLTEACNHPSRSTFRDDVWTPAVERADIGRHLRFHDLRGAHASWLLAGGQDIKAVALRLGWARLETANSYVGSLPDAQESSLAALRAAKQRYGRAA